MAKHVIVVGGGLAGLSATCELLERGCSVTLLEKKDNLGGSSSKATCGIAAPGSALQAAAGVTDGGADLKADGPAAAALVEAGTTDVAWFTKLAGVDGDLALRATPGHSGVARTIGTKTHFPGAVVTYAAVMTLKSIAASQPELLKIIPSATVTKIDTKEGKVVGVQYKTGGDETVKTLEGAVLVAAGGYAGDLSPSSVIAKHAPQLLKLPTTNDERTRGDAITLCTEVGAATEHLDQVQLTPMAAVMPSDASSSFKIVISEALFGAGGQLVDGAGKRFTDEFASAQDRVAAMQKGTGPFRLIIGEDQAATVDWLCNFYVQRQVMKRFGSKNDLAKEMKVASIDAEVGSGAVLVATLTPALYSCAGGVLTGWRGHEAGKVLSSGGRPIDGLFAAGEATSAPFSRLWSVSGVPLLYAVYSGRMAGRAAAGLDAASTDLRQLVLSSLVASPKAANEPATEPEADVAVAEAEKTPEEMSTEELVALVKEYREKGPPAAVAPAAPTGITMDEVSKHNTKEDAWIVVNGQVLDVTKWIALHPGGEQPVIAYLGKDATDEFNMIHKAGTVEKNLVAEGGNGTWVVGPLGTGAAPAVGGAAAPAGLTLDDVAKHSTESDCWIAVNGHAYDVTKFLQAHPGGVQAITGYAGKDCSDEWNMIHKPGTIEKNLSQGIVDMGPVAGGAPVSAVAAAPVDDDEPPPDGDGGIAGTLGAIVFLVLNVVKLVIKTCFFTGNLKFNLDNNRKGTIRSACFLMVFTVVHSLGNFVGMVKGPNESNGEGYFFDRLAWTGGLGLFSNSPFSIVEEYLALGMLLHVVVALKRSWDISINYCIYTGRWNMLLSGLTILFFLTKHLADLRFSSEMKFTMLRPPPQYVAWSGLVEGRAFYEVDEKFPLVRVRDLYTREVELFKDPGTAALYTVCLMVFWMHLIIGWKKLVPADAMQIPKDHVAKVTWLGWVAATAIVSMYLSVVWYTNIATPVAIEHVP